MDIATVREALTPWGMAGILLVGILFFALLILRKSLASNEDTSTSARPEPDARRSRSEIDPPERRPVPIPPTPPLPRAPDTVAEQDEVDGPESKTAPPYPIPTEPATTPINREPDPPKPTREQALAAEREDPALAISIWGQLGNWERAAKCARRAGLLEDSARIYLSLGQRDIAKDILDVILGREPNNERVRLRSIETLLDLGRRTEAEGIVEGIIAANGAAPHSAGFYESLARDFEAICETERAYRLYRLAIGKGDLSPETQQRALFLKTLNRLKTNAEAKKPQQGSAAMELLQRYIEDSGVISLDEIDGPESAVTPKPHEIIVGHIALGFRQAEPECSVRSVFSLSRRFTLERLVSESQSTAVFQARDRLLDFPVALKLYRLPAGYESLPALRDRLVGIAQLNHPNLAKLTFVDREGPVLRLATEYLPGGNLREFLHKLGGVGIPLFVRMAMHLASALHTAHMRGIPHGDIRPENILVGQDQRLKLVDFAISPIPVRRPPHPHVTVADRSETPSLEEFFARNEGIQSDLLQFAEVMDFMLQHARRTGDPSKSNQDIVDPVEEIRDIIERVRAGGFTSVLRLWQVLETVFDRTLPQGPASRG